PYRVSYRFSSSDGTMAAMSVFSHDVADLAVQNAAVSAINTALEATNETTAAAASVLTPPGGEGASTRAVAQQQAAVQQFAAMFRMGMEQLQERVGATSLYGAAAEAVEEANAASVAF